MKISKAAIFGTGKSAEFAMSFCRANDVEVVCFVDDQREGSFCDIDIVSWEKFLEYQFGLDALMLGKWQKGNIEKRAGISIPAIIIDEKSLKDYWFAYDQKKNMQRLVSYKNKHKGERCFIIGNGPSLQMDDLDKIAGELCFASNKIYLAFESTIWRPTYLCVEDLLVSKQNSDILNEISIPKFLEKETLKYLDGSEASIYEFKHDSDNKNFSRDITHGMVLGYSIVCSQIQMAYYMGFSEIYLLGVDFSFTFSPDEKGTIFNNIKYYEHDNNNNHFSENYREKGEIWTHPNLDAQYEFYDYVQNNVVSDSFKIYNASRKTKLDVFPLVDFDILH
ncbi:MAG: hypothetical protein C0602_03930 [Denitrovibrio sp.]|nr:MAG: hypothetical protein C0602_03930 [Denitrovibrio sp.]